MNEYNYENVIDSLNRGEIKQICFSVNNYAHYKNCIITRVEDIIGNGKTIIRIEVVLTKDSSERVSFFKTFEDNYKLFSLGKKGRFTLKQLWSEIIISKIV
jgi:phosphoribosylpyrophosphate synthetase